MSGRVITAPRRNGSSDAIAEAEEAGATVLVDGGMPRPGARRRLLGRSDR
jgi:hypothetical protein